MPAPHKLQPTLTDGLVRVSPLRPADFEALYAVASDPLLWDQHPDRYRYRAENFEALFAASIASGGALAVRDVSTGEVIGSSRYVVVAGAPDAVEIGWTFLARRYWGGRYNAAVKALMVGHAHASWRYVVFYVAAGNLRSARALEKVGARLADPTTEARLVRSAPDTLTFVLEAPRR